MTDYVAIIPCTNQKSTISGPAEEVWQGSHFQLTLYHAKKYYDRIFVMSYKYGLITPETVIDPYDIDIKTASAGEKLEWWWVIKGHIKTLSGENPDLIALYTGNFERVRFIREFIRHGYNTFVIPWETEQVGERMQRIYDDITPFDPDKLKAGDYELPDNWGDKKKRGRPSKRELAEREARMKIEWLEEDDEGETDD